VSEDAEVRLWSSTIGAVSLEPGEETAVFQYVPELVASGIEVSPLAMPLRREPYAFPDLAYRSFKGLPGLLADSLPDRYGNALIDAWLARQGRVPGSANAVERLCYTGERGIGALEYLPYKGPEAAVEEDIQVGRLVELASRILSHRDGFETSLRPGEEEDGLLEILSVGSSAGGARAKAMIAWNPKTHEIRLGQVPAPSGFEHWLLKFDGVKERGDREVFAETLGYGAIEFAYSRIAREAGVEMSECRLLEEGGRRHFMTRRFDRPGPRSKLHMQSLAALRHYDFNLPGAYSYEQALLAIRALGLPMSAVEQQFRRMAFNIVARNQDDHVKNIAFLMDRGGNWSLSPAFDVTYAYNPRGEFTAQHQMTLNGRRDGFKLDDFRACGEVAAMKRGRAEQILSEVTMAVASWPEVAAEAGVPEQDALAIAQTHRLEIARH
jgi:serine/threonine-protein kinase HipA